MITDLRLCLALLVWLLSRVVYSAGVQPRPRSATRAASASTVVSSPGLMTRDQSSSEAIKQTISRPKTWARSSTRTDRASFTITKIVRSTAGGGGVVRCPGSHIGRSYPGGVQ